MIDDCHIASAKPRKSNAAPVERDHRRSVDHKVPPTPVKLANRETPGLYAYDDAAVHGLYGCRAWRREHEGGAKEHQPEPSHHLMLAEADHGSVCCV